MPLRRRTTRSMRRNSAAAAAADHDSQRPIIATRHNPNCINKIATPESVAIGMIATLVSITTWTSTRKTTTAQASAAAAVAAAMMRMQEYNTASGRHMLEWRKS